MIVHFNYKYGQCPDWERLNEIILRYGRFCDKIFLSPKKIKFKSFADFVGMVQSVCGKSDIDYDDLAFLYQEFLRQRFITAA